VTLETTSNFQNIKDLLMGFVNSVVLVLQRRIQAQRDQIWDTILKVSAGTDCCCLKHPRKVWLCGQALLQHACQQ
jgi:hypothetical protein